MTQLELEAIIRHNQMLYYNGQEAISDEEFDALWEALEREYPNSALLTSVGEDTVNKNKTDKNNRKLCKTSDFAELFITSFYKSQVQGFLRFLHNFIQEENPYLPRCRSICHHRIRIPTDYRDRLLCRQEISQPVR